LPEILSRPDTLLQNPHAARLTWTMTSFPGGLAGEGDGMIGSLFSHADPEGRVPARHPLRRIWQAVTDALAGLDAGFDVLCAAEGRLSIAPERVIRASLIHMLPSVRPERPLMGQMQENLMFRWFVGLGIDDRAWGEGRPEICPVNRFHP
jgi:hypothetical protein